MEKTNCLHTAMMEDIRRPSHSRLVVDDRLHRSQEVEEEVKGVENKVEVNEAQFAREP